MLQKQRQIFEQSENDSEDLEVGYVILKQYKQQESSESSIDEYVSQVKSWERNKRATKLLLHCVDFGQYKVVIQTGKLAQLRNQQIRDKFIEEIKANGKEDDYKGKDIEKLLVQERKQIDKDTRLLTTKLVSEACKLYQLPKSRDFFFIKDGHEEKEGAFQDSVDTDTFTVMIKQSNISEHNSSLVSDINLCTKLFIQGFCQNLQVFFDSYCQEKLNQNLTDVILKEKVINNWMEEITQDQIGFNELMACQYLKHGLDQQRKLIEDYVLEQIQTVKEQNPYKVISQKVKVKNSDSKKCRKEAKGQQKQQQVIKNQTFEDNKVIRNFLEGLFDIFNS